MRRAALITAAIVLSISLIPPINVFAQDAQGDTTQDAAEQAAKDATKITVEEYYRENDINFFGKDINSCSAGGGLPANINVDKGFSLGTSPEERRKNLMQALMNDYGLSAQQAAGIVGNFMAESGGEHLPPDVNEGGKAGPPAFSGGYGWAQWTGGRQTEFINFATKHGYMASINVNATDAADYAWLKQELNTGYASTITELKTKTDPGAAAVSFEATFEKAGKPRLEARIAGANKAFNEFSGSSGGAGTSTSGGGAGSTTDCASNGGATIVGDKAFPLITSKSTMIGKNKGLFANGTTGKGGHPYTAFDILADPDTPVVAFLGGTVNMITQDRCPGRMISIYNKESDITVSYLHLKMSDHVTDGAVLTAGERVGVVGPGPAGCGTPHLHIDAAKGDSRPGCSRLSCPASNAAKFIDIGPDLFQTFEKLPE